MELNPVQAEQFDKLLISFENVFAIHDLDLGCMKGIEHHVDTGSHPN